MNNIDNRIISSFSRKIGRKLSKIQKHFLGRNLDDHLINDINKIENLINHSPKLIFEIGFGNGEYISNLAEINKDILFVGCEVFLNGVANLLRIINEKNLSNIKIWKSDARLLLKDIGSEKIDHIYILFPDPWPKTRHHKRRIISHQTFDLIYKKLKIGGKITIATDHVDYANHIIKIIKDRSDFFLLDQDLRKQPDFWIKTKYQTKAELQNINPYFFTLSK